VNPLRSLQAKLVAAFVLVTVVALALAAGLFVALRRDDQEQRELDRVALAAPPIFGQFTLVTSGRSGLDASEFVRTTASQYDVRVLLLDPAGDVAVDSDGRLEGKHIDVPAEPEGPGRGPRERAYVTWTPADGAPAGGLTLVTASLPRFRFGEIVPEGNGRPGGNSQGGNSLSAGPGPNPANNLGYSLVLGVPESTITNAWFRLLPGLAVAAVIALAVAVALGVFVARYVTRPLGRLTVAAQQVAGGTFTVDIDVRREDEVGRLGRAFSTMAQRVGATQSEMRSLVANVSHDLKTPLTSILGFSRALSSGAAADLEESRRMGGIIHDEAGRLAHRLEDLLYLSELDAGQAELSLDEVDLGALARSVAARVFSAETPGGLTVAVECPEGLSVTADGPRLERALENLVDNARKFSPPGARVSVRVEAAQAPFAAAITVENPAPELDAEEVPLLMRRFYRRDRNRSGSAGSGLGLPIAQDIARLHGGELSVEVHDGCFAATIRLPAHPPSAGA